MGSVNVERKLTMFTDIRENRELRLVLPLTAALKLTASTAEF